MRMYDIIKSKRDGNELSEAEIRFAINGYTDGSIPDYQMSALMMAICFRGMTHAETFSLTDAMMRSGDMVDLSVFGDKTADKHSTGGVGDKTSIVVIPLVASLGGITAKMSGRGLGHTGGTIDKLESFYGYKTALSQTEFLEQVKKIGIALTGQSGNLTPADKKLYALRDVTATVDSIPLITSSIMSKKLAAGAKNIVLDVKSGSGAFMKTPDEAVSLAREMVAIGKSFGRNVRALITNMDTPLGYAIGNALEVKEAIEVLNGGGPSDLRELCISLATEMISLTHSISEAREKVIDALDGKRALAKLYEWIDAQGSDEKYAKNPDLLPKAPFTFELKSEKTGYIASTDTEIIGICASMLGAGRTSKDDKIDLSAGIVMSKKMGDFVNVGDTLAIFHSSTPDFAAVSEKYLSSLRFSETKPLLPPLIFETV